MQVLFLKNHIHVAKIMQAEHELTNQNRKSRDAFETGSRYFTVQNDLNGKIVFTFFARGPVKFLRNSSAANAGL